jgi:hypothetical protein
MRRILFTTIGPGHFPDSLGEYHYSPPHILLNISLIKTRYGPRWKSGAMGVWCHEFVHLLQHAWYGDYAYGDLFECYRRELTAHRVQRVVERWLRLPHVFESAEAGAVASTKSMARQLIDENTVIVEIVLAPVEARVTA